jgi:hypothetical protein
MSRRGGAELSAKLYFRVRTVEGLRKKRINVGRYMFDVQSVHLSIQPCAAKMSPVNVYKAT